ncbi:MAG: hypothetical protein WBQ23_12255 [Bacteroidota bacterium]
MRAWLLVLILFLVSACQTRHLLDEIVRPNSTVTFEKLDGPRGDVVLSMVSNTEGALFAGTRGQGVLRSTDGGDSWEQTALQEGTIWPLYTAPGGSVIGFVRGQGGRRIVRSNDTGDSWSLLPDSVEKFFGNAVVRNWGKYIYSEGGGGLHRSTDDGLTWETLNADPFDGGMRGEYELIIVSDTVMYAGNIQKMYQSDNGGRNWKRILEDWDSFSELERGPSGGIRLIAKKFSSPPQVSFRSVKRLQREPNGSIEEIPVLRPVPMRGLTFVLRSGTMLSAFKMNSSGIWRSEDGGISWKETSVSRDGCFDFCQSPDGTVFAAMHGAILRSTNDGRTWEDCSSDISPRSINHLFKDANDKIYAGTDRGGLYMAADPTTSWGKPLYGLCRVVAGFSSWDGHLLIGSTPIMESTLYGINCIEEFCGVVPGLTVLATSDAGKTWTGLDPSYRMFPSLIVAGKNRMMYSNRDSANISSDGGWTWSTEPMLGAARNIFAAAEGVYIIRSDTLYFRESGTNQWRPVHIAPHMTAVCISGNALLCTTNGELSRSTDGGESWDSWQYTEPQLPRTRMIPLSPTSVAIVGWCSCALLSTDAGLSWQVIQVALGDYGRVNTALLDSQGHLLLGTTEGLYRSTMPMR